MQPCSEGESDHLSPNYHKIIIIIPKIGSKNLEMTGNHILGVYTCHKFSDDFNKVRIYIIHKIDTPHVSQAEL